VILLIIAVIGAVLIVIGTDFTKASSEYHGIDLTVVGEIIREAGSAALIAALLGFTVDQWLKAAIAQDAFEGAMGYVLPPPLREPVRWISGTEWICEEHTHHVIIKEINPEIVQITTEIYRKLRNITDRERPIFASLHLDEWGYDQKTVIIDCEIQTLNGTLIKKFKPAKVEKTGSSVRGFTEPVFIGAGDGVIIQLKGIEYKPHNSDLQFAYTNAPTISPQIILTYDEAKFYATAYSTGHGENAKHPYLNRFTFKGTLLQGQRVVVRWYAKEIAEQSSAAQNKI
jgi:hypothetical protein